MMIMMMILWILTDICKKSHRIKTESELTIIRIDHNTMQIIHQIEIRITDHKSITHKTEIPNIRPLQTDPNTIRIILKSPIRIIRQTKTKNISVSEASPKPETITLRQMEMLMTTGVNLHWEDIRFWCPDPVWGSNSNVSLGLGIPGLRGISSHCLRRKNGWNKQEFWIIGMLQNKILKITLRKLAGRLLYCY